MITLILSDWTNLIRSYFTQNVTLKTSERLFIPILTFQHFHTSPKIHPTFAGQNNPDFENKDFKEGQDQHHHAWLF